jgi:hypothetical protein
VRHGSSCGCPNCMEYGGPRSFERSIVKPTYEELESQLVASQERERRLLSILGSFDIEDCDCGTDIHPALERPCRFCKARAALAQTEAGKESEVKP